MHCCEAVEVFELPDLPIGRHFRDAGHSKIVDTFRVPSIKFEVEED